MRVAQRRLLEKHIMEMLLEKKTYRVIVEGARDSSKLLKICGADSLVTKEENAYIIRTSFQIMAIEIRSIAWVKDVFEYEYQNVKMLTK